MSNMVQSNVRERKFPCQEGAKRICMEETLRLIQLIPPKVTRTGSNMAEIASDTTQISENIQVFDNASRSVVAIRKDAMHKKRQIFYLPDANGSSRMCENRIVQARVIAIAEKVVRVEIFGVECSILARDLS